MRFVYIIENNKRYVIDLMSIPWYYMLLGWYKIFPAVYKGYIVKDGVYYKTYIGNKAKQSSGIDFNNDEGFKDLAYFLKVIALSFILDQFSYQFNISKLFYYIYIFVFVVFVAFILFNKYLINKKRKEYIILNSVDEVKVKIIPVNFKTVFKFNLIYLFIIIINIFIVALFFNMIFENRLSFILISLCIILPSFLIYLFLVPLNVDKNYYRLKIYKENSLYTDNKINFGDEENEKYFY